MEFFFLNPNGQEYAVDPDGWDLTRFKDASRPSTAKITVGYSELILPKAWVRGVEDGQNKFIGYVSKKPSRQRGKQTVEAEGVEGLLWRRVWGRYGYPGSLACDPGAALTRLSHLFNSEPPGQEYDRYMMKGSIGALWYVNSKISQGWGQRRKMVPLPTGPYPLRESHGPIHLFEKSIMRFPGGGKKSRLGTSNLYINGSLFPEFSTYDLMSAASTMGIYRNDDDVYFKINDTLGVYIGDWTNNIFFADNAFDTLIRQGICDRPEEDLYGPLDVTSDDKIGPALVNVAQLHGLNVRWRYDPMAWRCYMDELDDFSDDGLFEIREEDVESVEYEANAGLLPDALIGLGYGDPALRQTHSIADLNARSGAYLEETFQVENGFADVAISAGAEYFGNMFDIIESQWAEIRDKDIVLISSVKHDHILPGNPVRLYLNGEPSKDFAVSKVVRSNGKPAQISLGNRSADILDAMNALKDLSSVYIDKSMVRIGYSSTMTGDISVGDLDTADVPFTTQNLVMPAQPVITDRYRCLLDVSISPKDGGDYDKPVYCTIWVLMASSVAALDAGMQLNGGGTQWYLLGDTFNGVDVTNYVNWGGANYIRVKCRYRGLWSGANPILKCDVKLTTVGRYNI